MDPKLLNYLKLSSNINEPYVVRKKIVSLAVGYAIACHIPMPTTKVVNHCDFFDLNKEMYVRTWAGTFNEATPLDISEVVENARNFWVMRYNAVYNCPSLDIVEGDFFQSLFGAPNHFNEETVTLLNKHNLKIAPIYRAACLVLSEQLGT